MASTHNLMDIDDLAQDSEAYSGESLGAPAEIEPDPVPLVPTDPIFRDDPFARIAELIERRKEIDLEIARLAIETGQGGVPGQWHHCQRCGYDWQGLKIGPPRSCARCGSTGWNSLPQTSRSRKPEDKPHPNWERRRLKGRLPAPVAPPVAIPSTTPLSSLAPLGQLPPAPRAVSVMPSPAAPLLPPAPRPLASKLAELAPKEAAHDPSDDPRS